MQQWDEDTRKWRSDELLKTEEERKQDIGSAFPSAKRRLPL
jgi:hypothetical protein